MGRRYSLGWIPEYLVDARYRELPADCAHLLNRLAGRGSIIRREPEYSQATSCAMTWHMGPGSTHWRNLNLRMRRKTSLSGRHENSLFYRRILERAKRSNQFLLLLYFNVLVRIYHSIVGIFVGIFVGIL